MDANAQDLVQTIVTVVSTWGLQVVGAIAVLVLGRIVAGSLRRVTRRALERAKLDAVLVPFFAKAVYYLVLIAVVIAVLGLFGIETTSLIAVLGAAGLAVGLALQGTLSNFSAGVMLLVFRPFKVGDYVEVAGAAGEALAAGVAEAGGAEVVDARTLDDDLLVLIAFGVAIGAIEIHENPPD